MLFDAHIHIFPDKLKGKVLPKLSETACTPYHRDETLSEAIKENKKHGVTHALALHIATNPKQQTSVNDFAVSSQSENIFCFGSVHPNSDDKINELYRIKSLGLKGIKLHPDYQDFLTTDKNVYGIYETCQDLGLMISFHTGFDPYSPDLIHNPPSYMKKVADDFPKLTIISAHMGGMNMSDEVLETLAGTPNVFLDTAMSSYFSNPKKFEEIARKHGLDKILFGTDSPWSTATDEINIIEQTKLTNSEKDMIYFKNACRLFNI